jgi:hypothetical protein
MNVMYKEKTGMRMIEGDDLGREKGNKFIAN